MNHDWSSYKAAAFNKNKFRCTVNICRCGPELALQTSRLYTFPDLSLSCFILLVIFSEEPLNH